VHDRTRTIVPITYAYANLLLIFFTASARSHRFSDLKIAAARRRAVSGAMTSWRTMGRADFNRMAFGFERAHFNKQADLHISSELPRYGADGLILTGTNDNFMCVCVACEAFDLKNPGLRQGANDARPAKTTVGKAKQVVVPTKYLSGSALDAPNQNL